MTGSPPNQQLVWSQTSLAAGASTHVHVVTGTTSSTCGATLSNTASFTSANGGSDSASAAIQVLGPLTTAFNANFDGVTAPALPAGLDGDERAGRRTAVDDIKQREPRARRRTRRRMRRSSMTRPR